MKKSSKIILGAAVVVACMAIAYRAVNQAPDSSLPAEEQVTQILNDGGAYSATPPTQTCRSMQAGLLPSQ